MKKIIVVIISTLFLFVGSLYAETDDQRIAREKKEATNSYLGDNRTPRAEYRREADGYTSLHTIDELNKKDEQDRLFRFRILLQDRKTDI